MIQRSAVIVGVAALLLSACSRDRPRGLSAAEETELMCLVLQRVGPVFCGQSEIVDDAEAEILLVTEVGGSRVWSRSAEGDLRRIRVDKSTADSWLHRNTVEPPGEIREFLEADVPGPETALAPKVVTIAYYDLVAFFKEGLGWEPLQHRYPRVRECLILSAVGMSKDGKQALVLASRSSGPLGGETNAYVLERRDGRWRVRWVEGLWIS